MKTTKTLILSLILTMTTLISFSQMLYWAIPDNTLDMTTLIPSPIPGATGFTYTASNGAYDNSGTLLFYATADQAGISIIDPSGTSILLDPILYSGLATDPFTRNRNSSSATNLQTILCYLVRQFGTSRSCSGLCDH